MAVGAWRHLHDVLQAARHACCPSWPQLTTPQMMFTPQGLIGCFPTTPNADTIAFAIGIPSPERDRNGWRDFEQSGEALRQAKAYFADTKTEPLRSLLDQTPDGSCRIYPQYSCAPLPSWHLGRVVLIGDAGHAMGPNGQGSAMALEDATIMARLLASDTPMDQIGARFESIRRPRITSIAKGSQKVNVRQLKRSELMPQVSKKASSGAWAWWAKTWAFWLCVRAEGCSLNQFSFFAVVKRGKFVDWRSGYDVTKEPV